VSLSATLTSRLYQGKSISRDDYMVHAKGVSEARACEQLRKRDEIGIKKKVVNDAVNEPEKVVNVGLLDDTLC